MNNKVFSATYRSMRSRVDGTLTVTFDIEPADISNFVALFNQPDCPAGIVRLTDAVAREKMESEFKQRTQKPEAKLSQQSHLLSQSPKFWGWLRAGVTRTIIIDSPESCDKYLKSNFGIKSKSEFDSDEVLGNQFVKMRDRYRKFLNA